jgi:hypothetical protein
MVRLVPEESAAEAATTGTTVHRERPTIDEDLTRKEG